MSLGLNHNSFGALTLATVTTDSMRFALQALVGVVLLAFRVNARALTTHYARTSTDTCANVDMQLSVPFLGIPVNVGIIDLCFCLSDIPSILTSNTIAETAVGLTSVSVVTSALTSMVNDASDHKQCTYPDNAETSCTASNPCGFTCSNGFTPSPSKNPTDCVCLSPFKVCNGVCGQFGSVCPSAHPKKREAEILQRRAETSCDIGFTACGVYGWQGFNSAEAWECIDTASDLESCGGCTIAFGRNPARGVDCTSIPGVMDVACASGSCVVRRCLPGWLVSMDGSYCVRKNIVDQVDGDMTAAM
ncbi:hypothetical protein NM688_g6154 [Phlebia brevispora]|uniref:Uncharacterized protein n=1 Tax=Phlebia brevispora TaxID=194682 RepID=A0ACC1SJM6_9APHY|nr:hypothetical protein NM688_g6154 [Phlebia brevispora]